MTDQQTQGEKSVPGWLELYDLTLHKDFEVAAPTGAYVRGNVGPGMRFKPMSEILGDAVEMDPETDGTRGWVELSTLSTNRDTESVAPIPPYVHGMFDGEGHLYPDEPPEINM